MSNDKSTSKSSKNAAREAAAAARKQAESAEKRRDRMIKIIGGLVVLGLVGGIIAAAVITKTNKDNANKPNASHASPAGVDTTTYGYVVNSKAPTTGIPQVQLWEDFQCPVCKQFEDSGSAAALQDAAKANQINLQLRPTTFLDQNLGNDASQLATNAWGCAINENKALEYHKGIFAMQPEKEGEGYTQEQLLTLGEQVGLTGDPLSNFQSCVKGNNFNGWVANSQAQFEADKVSGTPTLIVNGKTLDNKDGVYYKPQELLAAIKAAA